MPTASEVIAYERSYVGKAKYVNDTQGPNTFDCVGLQDWCLDHFGLLYTLISGGVKPQTVYYFYSHFTGPKIPPGTMVVPGDIIIMGDPNASDYHNVFAHIGMVSDKPGYYISAYDPVHGITEYPIPTYSTFKVIWILRTGLSDMVPFTHTVQIGTVTIINNEHSITSIEDGSAVDHLPPGTSFPAHDQIHAFNVDCYEVDYNGHHYAIGKSVDTQFVPIATPTTSDVTHQVSLVVDGVTKATEIV
jgi:hypothetical protein